MYHVTLNGQGYLIDLDRYVRRSFDPFAAKRAQGDRSYADLRGTTQVLRLTDWSGGEGRTQQDQSGAAMYRTGEGIDVASQPGGVRLGPEMVSRVSQGVAESGALGLYNGHLMIGDSAGNVYRFDGASLTLVGNVGGPVRSLATFLNRLYIGREGSGAVYSASAIWNFGLAFTVPGASTGIYSMRTFYRQSAQYLYVLAAGNGKGGVGTVQWWDGASLSPIQYDFEQLSPFASAVLGNRLYIFASDGAPAYRLGVYSVDDSGSGGVYRHHVTVDGVFCWEAVVYQGAVYVLGSPGGRIFKWDGSTLTQVYQLSTPAAPYGGGLFGAAEWQGALWIGIVDAAGTLGLLRYDGTSWSRPVSGLAGTAVRKLQAFNGQLHAATARAAAGTVYGTTGGSRTTGTLETSLIDVGLPNVLKVLRSVALVHGPLASGQSVQIEYRVEDSGAWTTLGTSSAQGATTATFAFGETVACRQVAFRLALTGPGGAGGSPVVYDVLLRYGLAPAIVREWELAVVLEGTPEMPLIRLDGSAEPLTGQQLSALLWTAKGIGTPVPFVDLDGASRQVWIEEVREEVGKLTQRNGYQTVGKLRLVEA